MSVISLLLVSVVDVWNIWSHRNLEIIVSTWLTLVKAAHLFMLHIMSCSLSQERDVSFFFGRHWYKLSHFIHQAIYFCLPPLSHIISLHPILCVWIEGGDTIQARLLLWRLQHHVSLRGEWGHPRWPTHCWWYSHHRTSSKALLLLFVLAHRVKITLIWCKRVYLSVKQTYF